MAPGPTQRSPERQAIVATARRAWAGATKPPTEFGLIGEAAHWVAADAEGITANLVADFESRGLSRLAYLEVVGVVARLSNIDWYCRAIGAAIPQITSTNAAEATGNIHSDATITDSWVPMLGLASAPLTLDALPDEGDALRDLHEPMYLDMADILNWELADDLNRMQIEVLAARASYLNECFY